MTDDVKGGLTLELLAAEEAELRFTRFSYDDAWAIGSVLRETARARSLPIAIDITRGGQQVFHAALPGSTPDNDAWIERKVRATLRFGCSSMYLSVKRKQSGQPLSEADGLDPQLFAAAGGCFPVRIDDVGIVGTITVSGLPQVDDHLLVTEAIRAFLSLP
jgi:uncharacterized protein (UPF0303 family)